MSHITVSLAFCISLMHPEVGIQANMAVLQGWSAVATHSCPPAASGHTNMLLTPNAVCHADTANGACL